MYKIKECWSEFYTELDPDKRREIYQTIVQEQEDDGANDFRRQLMDLRYTDPKKPDRKVDYFLWNMVILPGYLRPMYYFRAVGEREIRGIIRSLGLETAHEWDETKRAAAYWEYYNTALRYLSTCKGPNYAKKLFGTMQSGEDEKLAKTARDFYLMTVTVPAKYEREKDLDLFIRALKDAFLSSCAEAKAAWKEAEAALKDTKIRF